MKYVNLKEICKIFLVYCISTVIAMCFTSLCVKNENSIEQMKNYIIRLIIFTGGYIILVNLFNVKNISIVLFLTLMVLLISIVIINIDIDFFLSLGNTLDQGGSSILILIALYTTLPFQMIIYILIGYNLNKFTWVIMIIYLIILGLLSCKFKKNHHNIKLI